MRPDIMTTCERNADAARVIREHPRHWQDFKYVYPVISRRSGGLSIGINLNIDGLCNFNCVYCMVDRSNAASAPAPGRSAEPVHMEQLREELSALVEQSLNGEIWKSERFSATPRNMRRLNDIAFSGNGEPTACQSFDKAVAAVVDVVHRHQLDQVKIVLITNASMLDRLVVHRGLELMDRHHGEVWAKLDAGDVMFYRAANRSSVPYSSILANLVDCGRRRGIVIQTMLMCVNGRPIRDDAFDQYTRRLVELRGRGCRIREVQLYTVARTPRESGVTPIDDQTLSRFAQWLRLVIPEVEVRTFQSVT